RTFIRTGMLIKTVFIKFRCIFDVATTPHMPLPEMPGCITSILQYLGGRRCMDIEVVSLRSKFIAPPIIEKSCKIPLRGKHTGQDTRAGRAADRGGAIVLGKPGTFLRKPV